MTETLAPRRPHHPGDPLATDVDPLRGQRGVNAGRAMRPARRPVHSLDLRRQFHIGPRGGDNGRSYEAESARGETPSARHRSAMQWTA